MYDPVTGRNDNIAACNVSEPVLEPRLFGGVQLLRDGRMGVETGDSLNCAFFFEWVSLLRIYQARVKEQITSTR